MPLQTDPSPPTTSRPRLERPREDRIVSGVCSGLARHLSLDVTLVRAATVLLVLFGGVGLLVYLVVLVMVPQEGNDQPLVRTGTFDEGPRAPLIFGALVVGVLVLGVGPLPWGAGDWWNGGAWILVVAVGAYLVWRTAQNGRDHDADRPVPEQSQAVAPTAVYDPAGEEPTVATPPAPARGRSHGRLIAGVTLVALGATGLVAATLHADLAWDTALATGVLVCGAVALASAPFGGTRGVLVLGFVMALLGGALIVSDFELRGGIGERIERPTSHTELPADGYRLAAGSTTVDLRDMAFPDGTTSVRVRQGFGEIIVQVPKGVAVDARGHASGGEVSVLGIKQDGGGPDIRAVNPTDSTRHLIVDARVGYGTVRVEQDYLAKGQRR